LGETPAYWELLSFLPPAEYNALMSAAGFGLTHGRRQLVGLDSSRAILAPELGGGYGVADLVVGRCLIEVKTAFDPAASMDSLRLPRFDVHRRASHRRQLAVRDVCPDLPLRPVDQLLGLRDEPVDQPRPALLCQRVPARLPDRHITGDRLRVTPGQLRR
jgi:hypothetical protein